MKPTERGESTIWVGWTSVYTAWNWSVIESIIELVFWQIIIFQNEDIVWAIGKVQEFQTTSMA